MKARLCNKDMCNLVDVLRELPETLEGIGIAGIATITVTDDGSISGGAGCFARDSSET